MLVDGAQPYTIPSTFGACSNAARHGRSDLGGGWRAKINATSKFPVEEISVVTLARTDTTLHHSQYWLTHWARVF